MPSETNRPIEKAIRHQGTIVAIGSDKVTLRINTSPEECGKCAIAALCNKGSEVDVPYDNPTPDLIGQQMTIDISPNKQRRAIVVFFVIPICIIILAISVAIALGASQTIAGLVAIAALVAWMAITYLISHKSSK